MNLPVVYTTVTNQLSMPVAVMTIVMLVASALVSGFGKGL